MHDIYFDQSRKQIFKAFKKLQVTLVLWMCNTHLSGMFHYDTFCTEKSFRFRDEQLVVIIAIFVSYLQYKYVLL